MSQRWIRDEADRQWMLGYDNPCGGFYATRFVDEEADEEADVLIGFGDGVTLDELVESCKENGLNIEHLIPELLGDERAEKKPLSRMQEWAATQAASGVERKPEKRTLTYKEYYHESEFRPGDILSAKLVMVIGHDGTDYRIYMSPDESWPPQVIAAHGDGLVEERAELVAGGLFPTAAHGRAADF